MKKFIKKIKSNKFLYILSVLIVGVFFILIARVTYAFLAPIINNAQTNIVIKGDTVDEFKLKVGNPLKLDATPTTLKENGTNYTTSTTATASLKANSTKNTATYNYYLYFQIENNTFTYTSETTPEIILTITNPNGEEVTSIEGLTYGTFNGVSGFDVTTQNGLFNIANNYSITSNSSTTATIHEWTITLTYLNQAYDQSGNFGKSMEVGVLLQKENIPQVLLDVCANGDNLTSCLTSLGTKGKSSITDIYYHNNKLINGAKDNSYRYAGANPNNYICLKKDTSNCNNDDLYRIIGVFDNKIKVIKINSATSLVWDADDNIWSRSDLKDYLNGNFLTGLSNFSDKIDTTIWKVGGNMFKDIVTVVPATTYQNEIVNMVLGEYSTETEYTGKIGLMYVSDYLYAASPSYWNYLGYYNDKNNSDGCNGCTKDYRMAISENWLYSGLNEWTITRYGLDWHAAFIISSEGHTDSSKIDAVCAARPTFFLTSDVHYVSGTGTQNDPIRIE